MRDSSVSGASPENLTALKEENSDLHKGNDMLRMLLKRHGIDDGSSPESKAGVKAPQTELIPTRITVSKQSSFEEKASLFLSLFHERDDVYARQWQSKEGKVGYSPACQNEWRRGICGKPKQKCADCVNAVYLPYNKEVIRAHLNGKCVVGIDSLMIDDTCTFLAIDFDEERWREDVRAVTDSCKAIGIPCAIEISRSGNGAHLWFFFRSSIEASRARTFGTLMLTIAMEQHARLAFSSYDRMFTNQDMMPKGGFGDLIALPFQPAAYKHGGAVFVDEQFHPYEDQWMFLSSIQTITSEQVYETLSQRLIPPMGELRIEAEDVENQLWRRKGIQLTSADFHPLRKQQ